MADLSRFIMLTFLIFGCTMSRGSEASDEIERFDNSQITEYNDSVFEGRGFDAESYETSITTENNATVIKPAKLEDLDNISQPINDNRKTQTYFTNNASDETQFVKRRAIATRAISFQDNKTKDDTSTNKEYNIDRAEKNQTILNNSKNRPNETKPNKTFTHVQSHIQKIKNPGLRSAERHTATNTTTCCSLKSQSARLVCNCRRSVKSQAWSNQGNPPTTALYFLTILLILHTTCRVKYL